MALSKNPRAHNTPSPIYGVAPGLNIGDFDKAYSSEIVGITNIIAAGTSAAIFPNCRVVKLTITVTTTSGAGSVDLSVTSGVDNFVATVATFAGIVAPGTYQLYLGGYANPTGDPTGYVATRYGPHSKQSEDITIADIDPATWNNYVGQAYDFAKFLSLDGFAIKLTTANFSGTGTSISVNVTPIS